MQTTQTVIYKIFNLLLSILLILQPTMPVLAEAAKSNPLPVTQLTEAVANSQTAPEQVVITEAGFAPDVLTVQVGQMITWVNQGSMPHRLVSGIPLEAAQTSLSPRQQIHLPLILGQGAGQKTTQFAQVIPQLLSHGWDSGILEVGQSFKGSFDRAGEYPYYDSSTPHLIGTIIVREGNPQEVSLRATPAPILIQDSDVGYIPGQLSVNEAGAASYQIKVIVPPGTGGMSPELSFVYDSRGGNGSMGQGWSLAGFSAINRCPMTLAQHGQIDGVDFDDNDQFCLDGQLLVAVVGKYGAEGTTYHTENDSFSKITSYGVVGNSPARFEVRTKAGLIMVYGATTDSFIEAPARNEALAWAVSQIKDTKGNYLTFSYAENRTNGEYYPSRVDYTGNVNAGLKPYNSVRFEYETRPDMTSGYFAGTVMTSSQRLKTVKSYNESTLVQEYRLTYNAITPISTRSRLASVTECDALGKCFAPTTFEWSSDPVPGFQMPQKIITGTTTLAVSSVEGQHEAYVDVNGDGLADKLWGPSGKTEIWVALATKTGFLVPQRWLDSFANGTTTATKVSPYSVSGLHESYADMNGDGLPDKIWVPSGRTDLWVAFSTGTGFLAPKVWLDTLSKGTKIKPYSSYPKQNNYLDMNGDGLTDKVWIPAGGTELWVALSSITGTGVQTPTRWLDINSNGANVKPSSDTGKFESYADLNGDGLIDKVWVPYGKSDLWVALSTGTGFQKPTIWLDANSKETKVKPLSTYGWRDVYVDLNGDGLPDKVWVPSGRTDLWVALSTGTDFQKPTIWLNTTSNNANVKPFSTEGRHEIYADLNNDGLMDKVWSPDGRSDLWVALSTGTGFATPQAWLNAVGNGGIVTSLSNTGHHESYTDINGDGLTDRVWVPYQTSNLWVAYGIANSNPAITKITTGHGVETRIEYKPLTDKSIYTKGTGATYPQMDLQIPLDVVSAYSVTNGVGGFATTTYFYEGLRTSLNGRGFSGFSKITVIDNDTGIKTVTSYRQEHPFKTMTNKVEQYSKDGALLSREVNSWAVLRYDKRDAQVDILSTSEELTKWNAPNLAGVTYFPFVQQQTSETYELNGTFIISSATTNTYDAFGNITKVVVLYKDGYRTTTENTYENDVTDWQLGRLLTAKVTTKAPSQTDQSRVSSFEYDSTSGLLTKEIIEPGTSSLRLTKNYQYDVFGNITQSTAEGTGVQARITKTSYDAQGRFVVKTTNSLGQTESKIYDARFGVVTKLVGPNGLTTLWDYDGFGRKQRETRADGTQTMQVYKRCNGNCPSLAYYYEQTEQSGSPTAITYLDVLDRPIRKETIGFNGQKIYVDSVYDAKGQVVQVSEPYFLYNTPLWSSTIYDDLGRPLVQKSPDNSTISTKYSGLTTRITNALNQVTRTTINSQGQVISSEDTMQNRTLYQYDGFGNLLTVTDSEGNVTFMSYDLRGRKVSMTDPDMGTTSYSYNVFDELVSQKNAKGQTTTFNYDPLGRVIGRSEPEGITNWEYDTATKGIGQLAKMYRFDGYVELYKYDALGRPSQTQFTLDKTNYVISRTYDFLGRPDKVTYPDGFIVQNQYNSLGYLTSVRNGDSSQTRYWQAVTMNARGQLESQTLGNGVTTQWSYQPQTGRLQTIKSETSAGQKIQDLTYQFDVLGNLTQRTDNRQSLNESFIYDSLNRLTTIKTSKQADKTISYDDLGNITTRSDVGNYIYAANRPHAVTAITGAKANTYSYDANGNRISSKNGTVTYNSANKPTTLTENGNRVDISYGPNQDRYKKVVTKADKSTVTTYYVGGLYELEKTSTTTITKQIRYISAGSNPIAIVIKQSNGVKSTRYPHYDHIGSLDAVTDEYGKVVERLSFDAWGNRRDATTWGSLPTIPKFLTARGFTWHEHLDEVNLIHMNGRVYDPVIGRFITADPFVQSPYNQQSLNRYSYVENNPLSYTDPSGYFKIGDIFKKAVNWIKNNWKPLLAAAIGIVATVVTGGWASGVFGPLMGAIIGGAAGGFASGFSNTLLHGGSISQAFTAGLTGAAVGAVTAGAFYGVGSAGSWLANQGVSKALIYGFKVIAHGAVGGLQEKLQGGRFIHGFLSGVIGEVKNSIGQVLASAIVGGTSSGLGGGKFANGGVTNAFGRLLPSSSVEQSYTYGYFGKAKLEALNGILPKILSPWLDRQNLEVAHEQYIGQGWNAGFRPGGIFSIFNSSRLNEFRRSSGYYRDDLMYQAIQNVKTGSYNLFTNNCQCWSERVRNEYNVLFFHEKWNDKQAVIYFP